MVAGLKNSIIEPLTKLGLTNNEAEICFFLIKHPNSNGYEISKKTGISKSTVYSSLEKLKDIGFIELTQDKSSSYILKPIEELEYLVTTNTTKNFLDFKKNYVQMSPHQNEELFITIAERENQIQKLNFMVSSAKKQLYISAGNSELLWIRDELSKLSDSIDVNIFSLSKLEEFPKNFNICSKNMSENYIQSSAELKNHWRILLIKDRKEVFLCGGESTDIGTGLYSKNSMIVKFCIEHFIHDVKISTIEAKYNINDDTHLKF